jgi:hypothetical protein
VVVVAIVALVPVVAVAAALVHCELGPTTPAHPDPAVVLAQVRL